MTPLTVARIVLREISLPLVEPFRISSGVTQQRRILLVELHDRDGATGWGECVAGEEPYYSAETVDTAWMAIEKWLAPWLLALEGPAEALDHPRELAPLLESGCRGHRMAKAALEMAGWELTAGKREISLAALLAEEAGRLEGLSAGGDGGDKPETLACRPRLPVGISLGIQPTVEELVEKAAAALAEGYRKIKLKIAPGRDLEPATAVRRELGEAAPLMVDANCAYRLADAEHLQRFDELGLMMIEQPFEGGDLLRHAALQRRLTTPLCLDESITGPARAEDMMALGAGRIVNLKPGRVGGFTPSLAIHALCRRAGLDLWCGGMLESGVGRAHNVALASLPGFTLPGDLSPSRRYWQRDLVAPEWTMADDGTVEVPLERPGMGVRLDERRIEALTVRHATLAPE